MSPLAAPRAWGVPVRFRAAEIAAGLLLCAATPAVAAPLPLAAHRALYQLSLDKGNGTSAPAAADGFIAYQFSGSACEGYVSDFRQMTELKPQEGAARISDMVSKTFEDGAARRFTFKTESVVNGGRTEEIEGKARKSAAGGVSVELSRPRAVSLSFAGKVMFPTEQTIHILAAARAGKHTFATKVFDGSDPGDKVHDTLAVIGRASRKVPSDAAGRIAALEDMRHWPVTVSYFNDDRQDELPDYILSFDLYENGISRALKLDYGDFTLKGKLTKLELLPSTKACAK